MMSVLFFCCPRVPCRNVCIDRCGRKKKHASHPPEFIYFTTLMALFQIIRWVSLTKIISGTLLHVSFDIILYYNQGITYYVKLELATDSESAESNVRV